MELESLTATYEDVEKFYLLQICLQKLLYLLECHGDL